MAETILIVDDQIDLLDSLEFNLRREGYETRRAETGAQALKQAAVTPTPDLVLLDLMLPDMSGNAVCRQLRETPATADTPILMLTARGEEHDRVVGFESGADDYVTKPFSVRELMLRVRAILRRNPASSQRSPKSQRRTLGRLSVDFEAFRVWADGDEVSLTPLEFKLLETLIDRAGRVQSRETLLRDVWDMNADVTTRTVDTHVTRLRKKLGVAGAYIQTLRGVGYRFKDAAELSE